MPACMCLLGSQVSCISGGLCWVSAHVPAIFRFICSSRPRKMGDLKPGWHFPCCPPLEHRFRMQDEMCQLAAGSGGGSLWQLDGNRAVVLISPSFGINPKRRELLQGKATQPCGHWIKERMEEWSVRTEEGRIILCAPLRLPCHLVQRVL